MSCNQLVRQLVPLLVDAAAASLQAPPDGTPARQAAIQALLQQRLATNAARALALPRADSAATAPQQRQQACPINEAAAAAAEERAPQPVSSQLLAGPVGPGRLLRLRWEAEDFRHEGGHGLLLLLSAAPPCSHLAVAASYADGSVRSLTGEAAVLPPLGPGLQASWVPRPWLEVLDGIHWQRNATRLLYLPFGGDSGSGPALGLVDVAVQGSQEGGTSVLGQVLTAAPTEAPLQLPAPGTRAAAALQLLEEHAAAVALQLPWWAWPGGGAGDACSDGLGLSLACLPALVLGDTPPWRLRIQAQQCSSGPPGDEDSAQLLPALLGVASSTAPADAVRVAASGGQPGSAGAAVALWDGLDPARRQLLLLSDPSCTYTLRCAAAGAMPGMLSFLPLLTHVTALLSRSLTGGTTPAFPGCPQAGVGRRRLAGPAPAPAALRAACAVHGRQSGATQPCTRLHRPGGPCNRGGCGVGLAAPSSPAWCHRAAPVVAAICCGGSCSPGPGSRRR